MPHISIKTKIQRNFRETGTSGFNEDALRLEATEAAILVKQAKAVMSSSVRKELMKLKADYNAHAAKWNKIQLGKTTTLDRVAAAVVARCTSCVEQNADVLTYIEEWRTYINSVKAKSDAWADQYSYLKKCLAVCGEHHFQKRELDCLIELLPFDNQSDILQYLPDGYQYPEV
jgi:hypothetical protein